MNSYLEVMNEIHVLYVDHELNDLINVTNLLETCHYRVTHFQFAAAAIQSLSNGKVKFDFIIANINSPDFYGCNLLQLAVNLKIPIILISIDDNISLSMRAIEKGAYLFIKKPITLEMVSSLWQHVAVEMKGDYVNALGAELGGMAPQYGFNRNPNVNVGDDNRGNRVVDEGRDPGYNVMGRDARVRRRVCTEWTRELHEKFMYAVEILGEGRCFPREILELMNVPGLTRMQVASHLQKCRKNNWRPPQERRSTPGASSSNGGGSTYRPRRFGSMPQIDKAPYNNPNPNPN